MTDTRLTTDTEYREKEILRFLNHLFDDHDVFELCAIGPRLKKSDLWDGYAGGKKAVVAGWFSDKSEAVKTAFALDDVKPEGIYIILNPCQRALLGRGDHRLVPGIDRTKDKEILSIRNLLIDLDPERPSGVSSTDEEHDAALRLRDKIQEALAKEGWPQPLSGDSGNGAHLIYRLPDLENTPENVVVIKAFLQALSNRFTTTALSVDTSVFNAARLVKLYGSWARKGDSTPDRPHRLARITSLPKEPQVVELEQLKSFIRDFGEKKIVASAAAESPRPAERRFDIKAYLEDHGIKIKKTKDHGTSTLFVLDECLFDPSHKGGEAAIGQTKEGKLFYQCFHDSCKGKTWTDARAVISGDEPLTAGKAKIRVPKPIMYTGSELLTTAFEPIKWVIPDLIPEGLTIIGGNPKVGKSWLALNLAISVSTGGKALGKIDVSKGLVLYLAMEDGARRLHARLLSCHLLLSAPKLKDLHFATSWPHPDEGGWEQLDAWLSEHADARLIVIDTLAKFWPQTGLKAPGRTAYHGDYDFAAEIKALADKHHVAILAVHHLKKAKKDIDDPIELLSGSMGLSGCADTIHVLTRARGKDEANLMVTGRDIDKEDTLALQFDRKIATWLLRGSADEIAKTEQRQLILDALREAKKALGPSQISEITGQKVVNVRKLLGKLLDEGQVRRDGYGLYILNTLITDHSGHSDHSGHTDHTGHTSVDSTKIIRFPAPAPKCDRPDTPITLPDTSKSSKVIDNPQSVTTVTSVPDVSAASITPDELMSKMCAAMGRPAPTMPTAKPVIRRTAVLKAAS